MPENFFALSPADRKEALAVAASRSGRPAHILEKGCMGRVPQDEVLARIAQVSEGGLSKRDLDALIRCLKTRAA